MAVTTFVFVSDVTYAPPQPMYVDSGDGHTARLVMGHVIGRSLFTVVWLPPGVDRSAPWR